MEQQNSLANTLQELIEGYRQCYFHARDQWPLAEQEADWPSPCLSEDVAQGESGPWQLVRRQASDRFAHVEEAMSIDLHESAKAYWNSYYSANITIDSEFGIIELLQPWNEEDYLRFQQNLVGHLLTQKRFKLPPTVFIGVVYDGEQVIGVDQQGCVWLETPARKKRQPLADSLELWLQHAEPVILPES